MHYPHKRGYAVDSYVHHMHQLGRPIHSILTSNRLTFTDGCCTVFNTSKQLHRLSACFAEPYRGREIHAGPWRSDGYSAAAVRDTARAAPMGSLLSMLRFAKMGAAPARRSLHTRAGSIAATSCGSASPRPTRATCPLHAARPMRAACPLHAQCG